MFWRLIIFQLHYVIFCNQRAGIWSLLPHLQLHYVAKFCVFEDNLRPGARIAWLGGHEKSILCEFERGTGAQEIYLCLDQRNKVWCEKSKGFFGRKQVTSKKNVFTKISRDFLAEIGISSGFCNFKSTKNTNFGLDLRSKAPNLLISSRHSPRLGGHNFCLGGTAPVCPPVAPGLDSLDDLTVNKIFYKPAFTQVDKIYRLVPSNRARRLERHVVKKIPNNVALVKYL